MNKLDQAIETWRRELLDLSGRNRLLNLTINARSTNALQCIAPAPGEILAELLADKTVLAEGSIDEDEKDLEAESLSQPLPGFAEWDSPTKSTDDQMSTPRPGTFQTLYSHERTNRIMLRLAREARSSELEQGFNILFAVFGVLEWRDPNERISPKPRRAPIVLLPVAIAESPREDGYRISAHDSDPEVNATLLEKLRRDFGVALPDLPDPAEAGNLQAIFEMIQEKVSKHEGWVVKDECYIGLFQYHKIRMSQDLEEYRSLAADHPHILALALDDHSFASSQNEVPSEGELDSRVAPEDSFTILDADSSQMVAIRRAVLEGSFIIDGPPGTGKSQTISNIIAESIARGKSVLFVSEKSAARKVVCERLRACGLGDFVLEFDDRHSKKADVVKQLGDQLVSLHTDPANNPDQRNDQSLLREDRANLNAHAELMNKLHFPLGRSIYQVLGDLARLEQLPHLHFDYGAIADLTPELHAERKQTLVGVKRSHHVLARSDSHPWRGLKSAHFGLGVRSQIQLSLRSIDQLCARVTDQSQAVADLLSIESGMTLDEIGETSSLVESISNLGQFNAEWFDPSNRLHTSQVAEKAMSTALRSEEHRFNLNSRYQPDFLEFADSEVLSTYQFGSLQRLISARFRSNRARIKKTLRPGVQSSFEQEILDIQRAIDLASMTTWFNDNSHTLSAQLHDSVSNEQITSSESWKTLLLSLAAVEALCNSNPSLQSRQQVVVALTDSSKLNLVLSASRVATELRSQIEDAFAFLGTSCFDFGSTSLGFQPLGSIQISELQEWAQRCLNDPDGMDDWLELSRALAAAEQLDLGPTLEGLSSYPPAQWGGIFEKAVLTQWLDAITQESPAFHMFRGAAHDTLIERFQLLDRQLIKTANQRVNQLARSRLARVSVDGPGEPQILRGEYTKRKRHLPLRRLFERIPNLLPALKPCVAMSPLSVAQFLPADRFRFDIVIFDEASQVRPQDAVGSILRGVQLIVAGDPEQLPPTSFFDAGSDDQLDDDDPLAITNQESILDAVRARGMTSAGLNWHYRSRHEDLIAFANRHIYLNRLQTFPSAATARTETRGIRFVEVEDGCYEDERDEYLGRSVKRNLPEAYKVRELVEHHVRERPGESLMVVAFNTHQRDAIREVLQEATNRKPYLSELFQACEFQPEEDVKNLELVQGDERDVIIISVGFGKGRDRSKALSHNFGPVNKDGGYRRLNVLTTRARNQVVVVSSIKASDINLEQTRSRGSRLLKDYLDFAENGWSVLPAVKHRNGTGFESDFEEVVAEALRDLGYEVHMQIGCSKYQIDLAIVDPRDETRYLLGIECDGATYHSGKTARDRDRLRQEILEGLGWQIHRIWSTDWIRGRQRELDRVVQRIDKELARSPYQARKSEVSTLPPFESNEPELPQQPKPSVMITERKAFAGAELYREAELPSIPYGALIDQPPSILAKFVISCVAQESPIHEELVITRISRHWGYSRSGSQIRESIHQAMELASRNKQIRRQGPFLWVPESNSPINVRATNAAGEARRIEYVAPEEIAIAALGLLRSAFSLEQQELVTLTARKLGYERTGSDIRSAIGKVIERSTKMGVIVVRNGRLQLPDPK